MNMNDDNRKVDLNIKNEMVKEIYNRFLRGLNFVYTEDERLIERERGNNNE